MNLYGQDVVYGAPRGLMRGRRYGYRGLYEVASLVLPLTSTAMPTRSVGDNAPSYSRATAAYVYDHEGVPRAVLSNEVRFQGARRVRNLCTRSELAATGATAGFAGGTTPPTISTTALGGRTVESIVFPTGGSGYAYSRREGANGGLPNTQGSVTMTPAAGSKYTWSFRVSFSRPLVGSEAIGAYVTGIMGFDGLMTFNSGFCPTSQTRVALVADTLPTYNQAGGYGVYLYITSALSTPVTVYVTDFQIEDVSGASNQNPAEYIPTGVPRLNDLINTDQLDLWTPTRSTVTPNAIANPLNGVVNADQLCEDSTATSTHFLRITSQAHVSGVQYTFSAYLKAGTRSWAEFQVAPTSVFGCFFDLTNGVVGTATGCTGAILPVGNGWYRCSITYTADGTAGNTVIFVSTGDTVDSYTGLGSGYYIYAYGAQRVVGASPGTYYSVGSIYPYYGACVDGVKYCDYLNGNTVASNVVTESRGAAIAAAALKGYLQEGARTNRLLQCCTWANQFISSHNAPATSNPWAGSFAGGSELIVNGTFNANVNNWTKVGGGSIAWDAAGRLALTAATGGSTWAYQDVTVVAGGRYKVVFTSDPGTATACLVYVGSTSQGTDLMSFSLNGAGTYTAYITATTTLLSFRFQNTPNTTGLVSYLDNVSIIRADVDVTNQGVAAPDGTNTACTLTANQNNATITQNMGTVGSAAKAWGVFMKRRTGTGTITLTMNNFAGGADLDVTTALSNAAGAWVRLEMLATVANEVVGIKFATSGDSIDVWMGALETVGTGCQCLSTPVGPTTTASVPRNGDVLTYPQAGAVTSAQGSIYFEFQSYDTATSLLTAKMPVSLDTAGNSAGRIAYIAASDARTLARAYDSTTILALSALDDCFSAMVKRAGSWGGSTMVVSGAGKSASASFDGSMGSANGLIQLISNGTGFDVWGTIRNVRCYTQALSAGTLTLITS